ncbi:hypothetical protein EMCRGX_G025823 [Ephydatia muelleri]
MRDLWVEWFTGHTQCTVHGNPKQPSSIAAAVDGSENNKMFSQVPRIVLEDRGNEGPSDDDVEDDDCPEQQYSAEADDNQEEMVLGDNFDGFESDMNPSN